MITKSIGREFESHRWFMKDKRQHSAGKGDSPRPIDYKKWSKNWDRIFKNKNKPLEKDQENDKKTVKHGSD